MMYPVSLCPYFNRDGDRNKTIHQLICFSYFFFVLSLMCGPAFKSLALKKTMENVKVIFFQKQRIKICCIVQKNKPLKIGKNFRLSSTKQTNILMSFFKYVKTVLNIFFQYCMFGSLDNIMNYSASLKY